MILGIYGYQDSGKTQMVEGLVSVLTRKGYRVATVKHAPHLGSTDARGKDTWRHRKAGADPVVLLSEAETTIMCREAMPPEKIVQAIESSFSPDLIILEGFKTGDFPKVSLGKIRPTKGTAFRNPTRAKLLAYVEDQIKAERILAQLPGLDCGKCGSDCSSLALAIAKGDRRMRDCEEQSSRSVTVTVNGKRLATGRFVSEIVEETVRGMLGSLRGYEQGADVEIRLRAVERPTKTRSRGR